MYPATPIASEPLRVGRTAPFWSGFAGGIAFAVLFTAVAWFATFATSQRPTRHQPRQPAAVVRATSDTQQLEHALAYLKAQNHELQEENEVLRARLARWERDAPGE
jgi:hypothetical protein